jgi:hypothetical protein
MEPTTAVAADRCAQPSHLVNEITSRVPAAIVVVVESVRTPLDHKILL